MASWSIDSIPAFCITLERRKDRWRRFQDQSGIEGLDLKKFIGVDAKTLDIKNDPRITTLTKRNIAIKSRRSHEEIETAGAIGCSLSHIAIWQWIVDNPHDIVLVFEDDADVPPDFIERANQCIKQSTILNDPRKWDIWLLGGICEDLSSIPGEKEAIRVGSFALSHAYVITKSCARKLLEEALPIHCHIDVWMSVFAYLNNIRIVTCPRLSIKQAERVKTDIQPDKICHICNIATDFDKNQKLVSKTEWYVAQAAEVLAVGLIAYIVYKQIKS